MVGIGLTLKLAMMIAGSVSLMFMSTLWASGLIDMPTPTVLEPAGFFQAVGEKQLFPTQ